MSGTELAIVLIAVVVGSVIKAVTGMGLPIIAIPIAALFVDLDDVVVTIAFPNLLSNAVLAFRERSSIHETRDLAALAVAGAVGAIIGVIAFVNLPEKPLVILLIVAILGYITTFVRMPGLRTEASTSRRWSPVIGGVAGAFQGAIGISGPIIGSWIHSYRLPRDAYIFSVTSLFFVAGVAQLTVLTATGELSGRVTGSLLACVPILASIPIGTRLRDRISSRTFDRAIVAMLAVSAIALLIKTFT